MAITDQQVIEISEEARDAAITIAEELHLIGWTSPNDAQWNKLTRWWTDKQQSINSSRAADRETIAQLETQILGLREVAEAAWRLKNYSYHDWSIAGGVDECRHGIAKGIHCQRCDSLLIDETYKTLTAAQRELKSRQ